jgi:lipid II:glycine glycyltransferase (peptidoglycan interpeptide bridge formation enzyme)
MVLPGAGQGEGDGLLSEKSSGEFSGELCWQFRGMAPADLAACDEAASFLQSGFWGSFKARFSWNARSFRIILESSNAEQRSSLTLPLLVIRRRLALGVSFAYVPWGPELPRDFSPDDTEKNRFLLELAKALKPLLPGNTAFIRFEPPWYTEGGETPAPPIHAPLRRSAVAVQPSDTVVVDLRLTDDEILKRMKPKWRYNIGLADKRGVTVRSAGIEGIEAFYSLYQETAKRDGISIHDISYYRTLFTHCGEYPRTGGQELRLYLAEYGGNPLAAIIVLFRRAEATYLYGASSNENRNLMATYALQWKAITDAKLAGCTQYDLFGIPPHPDPKHPMTGLYLFKTGFGGRIIHRPGTWDYAYKPLIRNVFSMAETLRKGFWNLRKKRSGRKYR